MCQVSPWHRHRHPFFAAKSCENLRKLLFTFFSNESCPRKNPFAPKEEQRATPINHGICGLCSMSQADLNETDTPSDVRWPRPDKVDQLFANCQPHLKRLNSHVFFFERILSSATIREITIGFVGSCALY